MTRPTATEREAIQAISRADPTRILQSQDGYALTVGRLCELALRSETPAQPQVPEGEERWLIEGTAYYPTRRCFWTGAFWADDYLASEPPALKAARYWSKHSAEAVIPTIKNISSDNVHFIAAFSHMFQCGIAAEPSPTGNEESINGPK